MSLRRNVIANYLGQAWVALMGFAFLPLYVRILGIESYGLIGFFTVLQGWMVLLDLGISPTVNREMARLDAGMHTAESIRDLLRTLETIYVGVALAIVALVWIASPWIASDWLQTRGLEPQVVVRSLRLMGFVLAARCAEQLYRAALLGLQDQVWYNSAQAALATLRWGGAWLVLAYVSSTVGAFFLWQGLASVVSVALLAARIYARLPGGVRPTRFAAATLVPIRRFAAGMFTIVLLSTVLMYGDKVLISKLLPLEQFGYYMLASAVAGGLGQLAAPMFAAMLPQMTALAARNESGELARVYLRSCEWTAAILVPPALVLSFFATPVLLLWTGDPALARPVAPLLAALSLGTLCNGLMTMPYALQLAHGWTGLTMRTNLLAVLLLGPAVLWAVPRYGSIGAALAWFALNAGYVLLQAPLMYRRLLPEVRGLWYVTAVATPLATGTVLGAALVWAFPAPSSRAGSAAIIGGVLLIIGAGVSWALPQVRHEIVRRWSGAQQRSA